MKSSMMALAAATALAGCSTGDGNMFASHEKTVEYYRVFDIKTDPSNQAVAKAATEGIHRNAPDATLAAGPSDAEPQEQPGRFKMVSPAGAPPGMPAASGPTCDGASWTAKAAPRVTGGQNMNMIACLFPYKGGYHLDMYAVFTKREGGWLEWPRRMTGKFMGTPEKWTEKAMADVVGAIRSATGAEVALVEAKPQVEGKPWTEAGVAGAAGTPGVK